MQYLKNFLQSFPNSLESFNRFLNLLVGVAAITGLFALFDYFNQRAKVTFDMLPRPHLSHVWIDEDAIKKYYIDHKYPIPDVVYNHLVRKGRVVIPALKDAVAGQFIPYADEYLPHWPDLLYKNLEIEKKLRLESYFPFLYDQGPAYIDNCGIWTDQLLPEVRKLSEANARVLEFAILYARRVENVILLKNKGDLPAKNVKLYIYAVQNLITGGKGSILSVWGLRPGPKPIVEEVRAELVMPILESNSENSIYVITREAPIFRRSLAIDYETERIVDFTKLAWVFGVLLLTSLTIVSATAVVFKDSTSHT